MYFLIITIMYKAFIKNPNYKNTTTSQTIIAPKKPETILEYIKKWF